MRDPTNTRRLQYLIDLADKSPGSLKFFKGDLLDEGSFAEGMKGCSIVFHTASPFIMSVKDPQKDLIEPALLGTRNVLNEATKTGTVKRVVLTSSVAAIHNDASDTFKAPGNKLTEEIWNTGSSLTYKPYYLSKTKAEQAAWEIAGSQTNWTLVVMNPGMVMGPGVRYHETSESYTMIKNLGGGKFASGCPNICMGVVDVRVSSIIVWLLRASVYVTHVIIIFIALQDVAVAHIIGAYSEKAKGRYILTGANTGFKEMAEVTRQKFPEYPFPKRTIPKSIFWLLAPYIGASRQMAWENVDVPINLDNSKSVKDLGMKYRPLAETMQDMFQQLVDEGVVKQRK